MKKANSLMSKLMGLVLGTPGGASMTPSLHGAKQPSGKWRYAPTPRRVGPEHTGLIIYARDRSKYMPHDGGGQWKP